MQNHEWTNLEDKYPEKVVFYFPKALYLSTVRHNATKIAKRMGFKDEHVFNIGLSVDEGFVNAIEHGACENDAEVTVEFYIYKDRLEVVIKDTGCGFAVEDFEIQSLRVIDTCVNGRAVSSVLFVDHAYYVRVFLGVFICYESGVVCRAVINDYNLQIFAAFQQRFDSVAHIIL